MSGPREDPHEELEALTLALAAEIDRAERRGVRLTPVAPALDPVPAPSPSASAEPSAAPAAEGAPSAPQGAPNISGPAAVAAGCADLESLRNAVAACEACPLSRTRQQTVFADGQGSSGVMFVGEAPGADEDASGVPFVGRAGQLLTDIITKGLKMAREDVYIANVLKCRPPGNRDPERSEKELCTHFLDRQIELLNPRVIIPLGKHASQHLLKTDDSMGRMRGRVHEVQGRPVVPTYHPAFLLRSPHMKRDCWQDIQRAIAILKGEG